jgi:hypothetical protein
MRFSALATTMRIPSMLCLALLSCIINEVLSFSYNPSSLVTQKWIGAPGHLKRLRRDGNPPTSTPFWNKYDTTALRNSADPTELDSSTSDKEHTRGKNIIVLCDGTGNEIRGHTSNVLRLFRIAEQDSERQCVYHDPGIGTLSKTNPYQRFKLERNKVLGLATGLGLDENVLQAYEFLMRVYEEGDRIYLFG